MSITYQFTISKLVCKTSKLRRGFGRCPFQRTKISRNYNDTLPTNIDHIFFGYTEPNLRTVEQTKGIVFQKVKNVLWTSSYWRQQYSRFTNFVSTIHNLILIFSVGRQHKDPPETRVLLVRSWELESRPLRVHVGSADCPWSFTTFPLLHAYLLRLQIYNPTVQLLRSMIP